MSVNISMRRDLAEQGLSIAGKSPLSGETRYLRASELDGVVGYLADDFGTVILLLNDSSFVMVDSIDLDFN
jgi:hypothetical protein